LPSYLTAEGRGVNTACKAGRQAHAPDAGDADHSFVKVARGIYAFRRIQHGLHRVVSRRDTQHRQTCGHTWLAPWVFGCVMVRLYRFMTGASALHETDVASSLEPFPRHFRREERAKACMVVAKTQESLECSQEHGGRGDECFGSDLSDEADWYQIESCH
jgi:hypothetical protein